MYLSALADVYLKMMQRRGKVCESHVCSPQCPWLRFQYDTFIVCVCETTHNVHLCSEKLCELKKARHSDYICETSCAVYSLSLQRGYSEETHSTNVALQSRSVKRNKLRSRDIFVKVVNGMVMLDDIYNPTMKQHIVMQLVRMCEKMRDYVNRWNRHHGKNEVIRMEGFGMAVMRLLQEGWCHTGGRKSVLQNILRRRIRKIGELRKHNLSNNKMNTEYKKLIQLLKCVE